MVRVRFRLTALALVLVVGAIAACGGGDGSGGTGESPAGDSQPTSGDSSVVTPGADGATPADGSASDAGKDAAGDAIGDGDADAQAPPSVRFIGRWETSDPLNPRAAWPGARIVARWSGTHASATFSGVKNYSDGFDRWDVTVDGVLSSTIVVTAAPTSYDLTGVLPAGIHTVELFKRTEAYVGTTTFGGFDFGAGVLLSPPPSTGRTIEFMGDSSSNGYGVDGAGPMCPNTSAIQNDHKAWPWLTAETLSAEHHNLSYSGRGVYWNYTRSFLDVFKIIYPRTLPDLSAPFWSFATFQPDVVWIMLGGNDWDIPNAGDPPPPYTAFRDAYAMLVTQVRNAHPASHIVLSVAPSLNDFYPPGYNARTNVTNALTEVKTNAADPKIHTFAFTPSSEADNTGCAYHANPAKHAAMAAQASSFVKTFLPW